MGNTAAPLLRVHKAVSLDRHASRRNVLAKNNLRLCFTAYYQKKMQWGSIHMKFVIEHLSKSFEKKQVLRDINFTFEEGKIYGLLGRNGAGKTTLFNCLNRDLKVNNGNFYIEDESGVRCLLLLCRNFLRAGSFCSFLWTSMRNPFKIRKVSTRILTL